MSERQLDDAIDRAVRNMMSVDADAAFRARVFDRLEHSKQPRRVRWRALSLAGAAALAIVLVVTLMWVPKPAPVTGTASTAAAVPGAGLPATVARNAAVPSSPSAPATQHPHSTAGARAVGQIPRGLVVATVAPEEPGVTIDALENIEPITLAPLETPGIAAERVVVSPLAAIEELQIEPLSPRTERD